MSTLWSYIIVCLACSGVTYIVVKRKPPLNEQDKIRQLQKDNDQLNLDKLNLKNRKEDLINTIVRNRQDIKSLTKENKEIKGDFKVVLRQQITILELLSSVTTIRERSDLNSKINVSERLLKKYESEFYESN
jgi:hypothetical protein